MLRRRARRGATLVEFALVAPVFFTLLSAILVGGLGTFRYQQVAAIAREASRWASVHGAKYAEETGKAAATASDIYEHAIVPSVAGLDLKKLSYTVPGIPVIVQE